MPFELNNPTQTSPEIHVEDVGSNFIVTLYNQSFQIIDISASISRTIRFRDPSGVSIDKTAVLYTDGIDGKIKYVLETGVIDMAGEWSYQVIITFTGKTYHSNIVPFTVYANLSAPVP